MGLARLGRGGCAVCGHGWRGALAERARRGPVRSQLHSQHRGAHRPRPDAVSRLSPGARAAHVPHPGRDHSPHGPRLLSPCALRRGRWWAGHGAHVADRARNRCAGAWRQHGRSRCSSPRRSRFWESTASCPIPSTTATAGSGFWLRFGCCNSSMQRRALPGDLPPAFHFACRCSSSRIWGCRFLLAAIGAVLLVLRDEAASGAGNAPGAARGHARCFPFWPARASRLLAAVLVLHWTAGIGNYLHWTMQYAGAAALAGIERHARRLSRSIAPVDAAVRCGWCLLIVAQQRSAKARWVHIAAFALLAAPFLFTLASLLIYDDADERGDSLLALWPLLLLFAPRWQSRICSACGGNPAARAPAAGSARRHPRHVHVAAALGLDVRHLAVARAAGGRAACVSRGFRGARQHRDGLCRRWPRSSPSRCSCAEGSTRPAKSGSPTRTCLTALLRIPHFPQLAGLATPGPYLPEIDELLRYAQANIPFDDGMVLRSRRGAVLLCHRPRGRAFRCRSSIPPSILIRPPRSPRWCSSRNIRWLIVKRDLQTKEDPTPNRAELMDALDAGVHAGGASARVRCVSAVKQHVS